MALSNPLAIKTMVVFAITIDEDRIQNDVEGLIVINGNVYQSQVWNPTNSLKKTCITEDEARV